MALDCQELKKILYLLTYCEQDIISHRKSKCEAGVVKSTHTPTVPCFSGFLLRSAIVAQLELAPVLIALFRNPIWSAATD